MINEKMIIAVASGKGGTGKTLVASNLFRILSKEKQSVALIDCDVEEPNVMNFIPHRLQKEREVKEFRPAINTDKCIFCKKCVEYCNYHAIFCEPELHYIKVIEDLCHGCAACSWACKSGAIGFASKKVGMVSLYTHQDKVCLAEGRMEIGNHSAVSTIKAAKAAFDISGYQYIIYDSPPGTSCPFMQTVQYSDYVILVTEPTPFGLSDLKQTVETLKLMDKPFGIIVNRSGLGDNGVYEYIKSNKYSLLAEIPYDQKIAKLYSKGELIVDHLPEVNSLLERLVNVMYNLIFSHFNGDSCN